MHVWIFGNFFPPEWYNSAWHTTLQKVKPKPFLSHLECYLFSHKYSLKGYYKKKLFWSTKEPWLQEVKFLVLQNVSWSPVKLLLQLVLSFSSYNSYLHSKIRKCFRCPKLSSRSNFLRNWATSGEKVHNWKIARKFCYQMLLTFWSNSFFSCWGDLFSFRWWKVIFTFIQKFFVVWPRLWIVEN